MWNVSNSETVSASPDAIWKLWEDVANWPKQDESIVSASLAGPFAVGSKITIKPKGSPTVKVVLKTVEKNKYFESVGKLPLTKLHFIHAIEASGKQTKFTQTVMIDGPLSGLFAKMMGPSMGKNLTARMKNMAKMLQK